MRSKVTKTRRKHKLIDFIWLVLPVITLLAAASYVVGALVLRSNPPALAIQSQAMYPTIPQGDLAIIKSVNTAQLKTGDIIAIKLTPPEQVKYSLPGEIVRRIVKINRINGAEIFTTKGDGNPANDPFSVAKYAVAGEVITSIPVLGYPILFFSSRQGIIFLIATAVILFIYYILGFLEDRRHYAHATAATLQNVMEMVGYVHDAVQQNQSKALEQLTYTRPELQTTLDLARQNLSREAFTSNPPTQPLSPEPPTQAKTAPLPDIKDDLQRLLQRSIELKRAAEWADTGELGPEHLRNIFLQAVETIEALLDKVKDSELAPRLKVPSENEDANSLKTEAIIDFVPQDNNANSDAGPNQAHSSSDHPENQVIPMPPIEGSIGVADTSFSTTISSSDLSDKPSPDLQDRFAINIAPVANSESTLAQNANGYAFYSPTDDKLLAENESVDIFSNQYSIFELEENDPFDETQQPPHLQIEEPSIIRTPGKRHHRRTIRRRD